MEKFILRGYSKEKDKAAYSLNLPPAKTFTKPAAKASSEVLFTENLIANLVKRKKYETTHTSPFFAIDGKVEDLREMLQQLLASHPFPVSQGPINIPLDMNTEIKESVTEVLTAKTVFSHSYDQACGRWAPVALGTAAWTGKQGQVNYNVTGHSLNIEGAASTMDMSLLYTCQLSGCIVECPCHVCTVARKGCCKLRHNPQLCRKCDSQCTTHQIKVPYLFNAATDLYTIVTEKLDKYRFAYGYAGIPSACKHCSNDVLEHQILHLVPHKLCRYCRFEMRPLEFRSVKSLKKYKKREETLTWRDNKTCSVCLVQSKDKYAREQHEAIVHRQEIQNFKCDICPKSYTSQNALSYHIKTHQQYVEKPTCELCGSQFASSGSLSRHVKIIHKIDVPSAEMLNCKCGQKFSLLSHLKRHQREQHFDIKFNLDFHEGLTPLKIFECDKCEIKFKRKEHLSRHISNKHGDKTFICLQCDQKFGRIDNLNRHVKSKH